MRKDIDRKFAEIDEAFDKLSKINEEVLRNAQIRPIHDKFPFMWLVWGQVRTDHFWLDFLVYCSVYYV